MLNRIPALLCLLGVATLLIPGVWAGPTLKYTDARELEIVAKDGTSVAKLSTGTIGKQITADNLLFKVSYGKDLRGRTNVIVYPDPEKPQALDLTVLGQAVQISSDAVLTVIEDSAAGITQFQAGMVGTVTVGGQALTAGASAKLAQGNLATLAANEKAFPEAPKPPASTARTPGAATDPALEAFSAESEPPPTAIYEGPKVRMVEGDVMFAPPGRDILEMVRSSAEVPRLQENQTLAPGTVIQTGPNGKAMVSPFPGCVLALQPNSKMTIEDARYEKSNGDYTRKVHLNLVEGGVISTIKGIKPETLDYQVKTPLAVAAARGTVFGVWADALKTLVIVSDGTVKITGAGGETFEVSLLAGNKILITRDGGAPQTFNATPEEIQAFKDLVDSIRNLLASGDIAATGEVIGFGNPGGSSLEDDTNHWKDNLGQQERMPAQLENAINNYRRIFQPRLNDIYMTPILSPNSP